MEAAAPERETSLARRWPQVGIAILELPGPVGRPDVVGNIQAGVLLWVEAGHTYVDGDGPHVDAPGGR